MAGGVEKLGHPEPGHSHLAFTDRLPQGIRWYLEALADLLFPPQCPGCGRVGVVLCDTCLAHFEAIGPPYCRKCGQPLEEGDLCSMCRRGRFHHLDWARSAAVFQSPLREAVHDFKYQSNTRLAEPLARYMEDHLPAEILDVDALIPVPLHPKRHRERGYNQAALLARHLSRATHIPVREDILVRVRYTRPQVNLGFRERIANMEGAFAVVDSAPVRGRSFLLIDDVMTSGSTLEACARALKEAGAARVIAYTLARASFLSLDISAR
ncbi:MAG: ComF family protein [Chloroflexi bacterium]|nr:ComF family protein [Chloroflexota bacterium]